MFETRSKTHLGALLFAAALLLLIAVFFASFAIGAYQVYDKQLSNVVAVTSPTNGGAILSVTAVGLNANTPHIVWVDPQISYDSNGTPTGVTANSGARVAEVYSDNSGNVVGNFSISEANMSRIQSDGRSMHSLWVVGVTSNSQSAGSQSLAIASDSETNISAATVSGGVLLFVTLFEVGIPIPVSLGTVFIILWTFYLILFAMALNGPGKNLWNALRVTAKEGLSGIFANSMLAMTAIYTLLIGSSLLITLLQSSVGVSTGSLPPTDPLLQFLGLTIAPMREELGFRVIPIGVGAMIVLFSRKKIRDGLLSLWHPSKYLKKNDNREQYGRDLKLCFALITLSAALFGLAHFLLGSGWGPGKITSAAIAGVGFGALYFKFGFPAAVLSHWADDYVLYVLSQNPVSAGEFDLIFLFELAVSVASGVVLLALFLRRLRSASSKTIFSDNVVIGGTAQ